MRKHLRALSAENAIYHHRGAQIIILILFLAFLFFRFFELQERSVLGWDQTDSAWAAKSILKDNPILLKGVPIKGDPGLTMGPLYYYLITPFYAVTNLDMSASALFASVIATLNFVVFFILTKSLFGLPITLFATAIYVFSFGVIDLDRVQAAYTLIPSLSYVIFYFLYGFLRGKEEYVIPLAALIGFGFHIHFSTFFYVPILLLTVPFFPRTKKAVLMCLLGLIIGLLFVLPMAIPLIFSQSKSSGNLVRYLSQVNHGFHLRRMLQLSHDAFIAFESVLKLPWLRPFVFIFPVLFALTQLSLWRKDRRSTYVLFYLIALWFVVPWILLSMFSGELTWYYFSLPRNLAIVMIGTLLFAIWNMRNRIAKPIVLAMLGFYIWQNTILFFSVSKGNYLSTKAAVLHDIEIGKPVEFVDRHPNSYMYHIFTTYKK